MLMVVSTETRWDEKLNFLSEKLSSAIAEQRFSLGIYLHDRAVLLNGDDGIRDCLKQGAVEEKISQGFR